MNEITGERIAAALERIAASLEELLSRQVADRAPFAAPEPDPEEVVVAALEDQAMEPRDPRQIVEDFLMSQGIRIKVVPPPNSADDSIDQLAWYLGTRYSDLTGLLRTLKRTMQAGRSFQYQMAGLPQSTVSSSCQFCVQLHELAFLTQYTYLKSPKYVIHATPSTAPAAQKFLSGHWLERYVARSLREAFGGRLSILMNPQIILPNGDDFELDVIAVDPRNAPLWIEAKTGDYQNHVVKYSKVAKLLGVPTSRSIMILPEVPEDKCLALSGLFQMTVVNLPLWEAWLKASAIEQ